MSRTLSPAWLGFCACLLAAFAPADADELEMIDGRTFVGQVISQTDREVQFRMVSGIEMTLRRSEVKTIRIAPLPKQDPPKVEPPKTRPPDTPPATQPASTSPRTVAELDALIDLAGRTPPDWWDSQPDSFPKTLEMNWPDKSTAGWNPNRNTGVYFITVINQHGETRAKEGVKAAMAILASNKDNKSVQFKAMLKLGQMYGVLLHDYARGAFWYKKAAGIGAIPPGEASNFAYCYWKLDAKAKAIAELKKPGSYDVKGVRMLGQIGEVAEALRLARNAPADVGNLAAGDVLRHAGRFKEAADFYRKASSAGGRNAKARDLAAASAEAMPAFEKFNLARTADGRYEGRSAGGYRGPAKVEVVVKAGRIESIRVTENSDDWPMTARRVIPAQVVEKQSLTGIDTVTGATWTSGAVINAIGKALGDATK